MKWSYVRFSDCYKTSWDDLVSLYKRFLTCKRAQQRGVHWELVWNCLKGKDYLGERHLPIHFVEYAMLSPSPLSCPEDPLTLCCCYSARVMLRVVYWSLLCGAHWDSSIVHSVSKTQSPKSSRPVGPQEAPKGAQVGDQRAPRLIKDILCLDAE